jgi:signal transduction histidine kinase
VTLHLDADPQLPRVMGNWDLLLQVFDNLVGNALRHTPADERVTLSVSRDEGDVVFEVEDRGEGIPAAHLPRLFERFHRVDKARSRAGGGAGLGLAIVKTLVEAHGGTVTAESGIGRGSRFTVRMPLAGHG